MRRTAVSFLSPFFLSLINMSAPDYPQKTRTRSRDFMKTTACNIYKQLVRLLSLIKHSFYLPMSSHLNKETLAVNLDN